MKVILLSLLTFEYHCYQVTKQLVPLNVGFTVLGLGICFGYNCGYPVNPARDLAPCLFTALAGWGPGVFTSYSHWWVVPVLSCHAGGVAGAWLYYLAVELHWTEVDKVDKGILSLFMGLLMKLGRLLTLKMINSINLCLTLSMPKRRV